MPYKIISTALVKYDLSDAIDYYNALSLKLGVKFENDFSKAVLRLKNTPQHYFNLMMVSGE